MPSTEHHMENISHLNATRLPFAKVLNAAESAVASQAGGAHAVKRVTLPIGRERTSCGARTRWGTHRERAHTVCSCM
jgi:hypothetical protein